jgi:integrase
MQPATRMAVFRRLVYGDEHTAPDPIARIELPKLATRHVAEWKKRVLAKGGTRSYYNRNATAFRAALNLAKSRGEVASDHAWANELKPMEAGEGRRTLYFDRVQRRELIANASDDLRPLVTAMALLPMRPGELVHVKVEDLDVKQISALASAEASAEGESTGKNYKWPWGEHETELLRMLDRAGNHFWKRYDPSDPTTAPASQEVKAWLRERGVTARVAEAMTTMLRADGLPRGPRSMKE